MCTDDEDGDSEDSEEETTEVHNINYYLSHF